MAKRKKGLSLALIDWAGTEEVAIVKGAKKALKELRKRRKSVNDRDFLYLSHIAEDFLQIDKT